MANFGAPTFIPLPVTAPPNMPSQNPPLPAEDPPVILIPPLPAEPPAQIPPSPAGDRPGSTPFPHSPNPNLISVPIISFPSVHSPTPSATVPSPILRTDRPNLLMVPLRTELSSTSSWSNKDATGDKWTLSGPSLKRALEFEEEKVSI